jgi:osmotically-inducible protein OsmY
MKTDNQIQEDVIEQLRTAPYLHGTEVGVAVKNGIVTLSGSLDSYFKKISAENAVKKVSGVKAVAEEIQLSVIPAVQKTDTEIAEAVANALRWHSAVQNEKVKIKVEDGVVWLQGEVDWEYQRTNAKSAIQNIEGVRNVTNLITITPKVAPKNVERMINAAFHRHAAIEAKRIHAEVVGNKIILTGEVRSNIEKEEAESAAWQAPGINNVENRLKIEEPEYEY